MLNCNASKAASGELSCLESENPLRWPVFFMASASSQRRVRPGGRAVLGNSPKILFRPAQQRQFDCIICIKCVTAVVLLIRHSPYPQSASCIANAPGSIHKQIRNLHIFELICKIGILIHVMVSARV